MSLQFNIYLRCASVYISNAFGSTCWLYYFCMDQNALTLSLLLTDLWAPTTTYFKKTQPPPSSPFLSPSLSPWHAKRWAARHRGRMSAAQNRSNTMPSAWGSVSSNVAVRITRWPPQSRMGTSIVRRNEWQSVLVTTHPGKYCTIAYTNPLWSLRNNKVEGI
jgi:hypothetical protein